MFFYRLPSWRVRDSARPDSAQNLEPVKPGMDVHIIVTFSQQRLAGFELRCDEAIIATGVVELANIDNHDK